MILQPRSFPSCRYCNRAMASRFLGSLPERERVVSTPPFFQFHCFTLQSNQGFFESCVFESYRFLVKISAYADEAEKDFGILAGPTRMFQRSHILERGRSVATSSDRPSRPSSSTSYHRYNSITIAEPRPGTRLPCNTMSTLRLI